MASDASDIQRIALRNGSDLASPAPSREPERRLGLALVVISLTQLMLVLDELIVNTAAGRATSPSRKESSAPGRSACTRL